MNTKKIDLRHVNNSVFSPDSCRHPRNKSYKLFRSFDSNPNMPTCVIARGAKRPLKKIFRVVKPKHIFIIFNIIVGKEIVNLRAHLFCIHVASNPFVRDRKVIRFLLNFG
ncbi:hypothetical protein HanRHA438_Chr05g0218101 [Helianthus annuus]|nr:hypothetical protein HanRHA438_Chr05g0218101 [Helianthus annuus]